MRVAEMPKGASIERKEIYVLSLGALQIRNGEGEKGQVKNSEKGLPPRRRPSEGSIGGGQGHLYQVLLIEPEQDHNQE